MSSALPAFALHVSINVPFHIQRLSPQKSAAETGGLMMSQLLHFLKFDGFSKLSYF